MRRTVRSVLVGLVCIVAAQPIGLSASAPGVSVNYINVNGSDVTINVNVWGNYTSLFTNCNGIYPLLPWPNELVYPTNWFTNSGLSYFDIGSSFSQTQYGGSGYVGCTGGGPAENQYNITFTFNDPSPGTHTFYYRVTSDVPFAHEECSSCSAIEDYWVEIQYTVP